LTTGTADTIVGTAGSDTITGLVATAGTTYQTTDVIIDQSSTDNDTFNLTSNDTVTLGTVSGVENVNITINSTDSTDAVDTRNMTGVEVLTVTRGNLTVGGSTIAGNKQVNVDYLDSTKVAKVVVGAGTTIVDVDQTANTATDSKAGAVVDASVATGNVTVTGAATLDASASTGVVTVQSINAAVTDENAKAVSITANNAATIVTNTNTELLTGAITINAAKASSVTVDNATGGVTMTAGTTSTADTTIRVDNIDASGATITTGTGSSTAADKQITLDLDGTALTTDTATVSAAGYVSVDSLGTGANLVETLSLSGNGAAVTYAMTADSASTSYTLTGSQSVTVQNTAANFAVATLTDSTTAGTTTAKVTTVATADLSGIAADVILLSDTGTSATMTVATGANIQLGADQTTAFAIAGKTANATVNLAMADDTAANGTTIELTVAAFTASSNVKTLNLDATVGRFTATGVTLDTTGSDATTLNIAGTKNVTLGNAAAKTIAAADFTGALSVTSHIAAATAISITSGSGDDSITANDSDGTTSTVYTVNAGDGTNTIIITDAQTASSFTTGSGDDTFTVTDTEAYVIVTGAGNDSVSVAGDSDSIIAMGDGTTDALTLAAADLTDNTNFAYTGVEKITTAAGGTVKISAAQFAGDNSFQLLGTSATADILRVTGEVNAATETAGVTIDASSITFASTQLAKLELEGTSDFADTITGSAKNDTIIATKGADVISGGDGTDTYDATALDNVKEVSTATNSSTGVAINLSASAVTNTTILGTTVGYTADAVTTVASNTVAYLYSSSDTTNSAVVQTLSSIENAIGSDGADYIVGSVGANTITGGAGNDYILGGLGNDTFVIASGTDTIADLGDSDVFTIAATAAMTATATRDFTATSSTVNLGSAAADAQITAAAGIDIDMTLATVGTASTDGFKLIGGGTGVSILKGSTGDDTITAGAGGATITGGAGADTITGAAGVDTITFAATGALNGADTIATFAVAADILDFSAFALTAGSFNSTAVAVANTGNITATNKVTMLNGTTEGDIDGASEIAAFFGTDAGTGTQALDIASGGKAIILSGDASGATDSMRIWYVNDSVDGTAGTINAADVVLVGTIATFDLDTVGSANFTLA